MRKKKWDNNYPVSTENSFDLYKTGNASKEEKKIRIGFPYIRKKMHHNHLHVTKHDANISNLEQVFVLYTYHIPGFCG